MKKAIQRIMIFGRPGSGKSTFAYKLHKKIGLPLYHIDKYFFTVNWAKRDFQDFLNDLQEIVDQDKWIIDGTSMKTIEMRYACAEVCIYLNISLWVCYVRIFKRLFGYKDPAIKDRAEGCEETINWSFFKLLQYMWTFKKRASKALAELREKYPQVEFIEVTNDNDLKKLEKKFQ